MMGLTSLACCEEAGCGRPHRDRRRLSRAGVDLYPDCHGRPERRQPRPADLGSVEETQGIILAETASH